jgi:hypothetical protein
MQVVGVTGLEPVTPRLSSACSNQLSYTPNLNAELRTMNVERQIRFFTLPSPFAVQKLVELRRLELLTYSLQSYRSTN